MCSLLSSIHLPIRISTLTTPTPLRNPLFRFKRISNITMKIIAYEWCYMMNTNDELWEKYNIYFNLTWHGHNTHVHRQILQFDFFIKQYLLFNYFKIHKHFYFSNDIIIICNYNFISWNGIFIKIFNYLIILIRMSNLWVR